MEVVHWRDLGESSDDQFPFVYDLETEAGRSTTDTVLALKTEVICSVRLKVGRSRSFGSAPSRSFYIGIEKSYQGHKERQINS